MIVPRPKEEASSGERVGPLLALGARGDIGLHGGRRGRAEGAVEGPAEDEDREHDDRAGLPGEPAASAPPQISIETTKP